MVYKGTIHRIPQKNLELNEEFPAIIPPQLTRQPIKPKKARRREEGELAPAVKRKRNAIVVCGWCMQLGHNKKVMLIWSSGVKKVEKTLHKLGREMFPNNKKQKVVIKTNKMSFP